MPGDEELVAKKPKYIDEYSHSSWRTEATNFENQVARKLYDQEVVKLAGQTALSKVSTLLVRYNRLKRMEDDMQDNFRDERTDVEKRYEAIVKRIEADRAEAEKIEDKTERDKAIAALDKEAADAKKRHDDRLAAIDATVKDMELETLKMGLDRDVDGSIRAATMLGGKAEGGRGYNLSTGGTDDTVKAGLYIDEMAGNEGNLFDQMGLLENAVNSASLNPGKEVLLSTDVVEGPDKKPVLKENRGTRGKVHDLHSILANMSEEDFKRMDGSWEGGLGFSYQDLDQFRKDGKLEAQMGKAQESTGLTQELFDARENDAAKDRREGSHISKFNKFKNHFSLGVNGIVARGGAKMTHKSIFGDLFTIRDRRAQNHLTYVGEDGKTHSAWSNAEKRKAQRKADQEWFEQFGIYLDRSQPDKTLRDWTPTPTHKTELTGNKADTSASLDEKIGEKDLSAIAKLQEAGFIRASVLETKKVEGKPDQVVKTLTGDKSARNMMTAYKLLGAKEDELLKFRLAIIAYMVPTGKKTIYDIIDESRESGVSVAGIDLSEQGLMYETFVKTTNDVLGIDITEAPKQPEDDKKKGKDKPKGEAKESKAPQAGIRLPMKIVHDYIEKEKKEKKDKKPGLEPLGNFQGRKRSSTMPTPPKKPLPKMPVKKKNPNDPKKDMGDAQTLERFKTIFGDITAQAAEIFESGGNEEFARKLSEKLRTASANEEKKTALKGFITEMKTQAEGGTPEKFWEHFVNTFGTAYLQNTVGTFNNSQFEEQTGLLIVFLKESVSDLKTMIMELYNAGNE